MGRLFRSLVPAIRQVLTLRRSRGADGRTATSLSPLDRPYAVYKTKNTEYHVWHGVCVATRPLRPSDLAEDHGVVNMRMAGCLLPSTLVPKPIGPKVGYRIAFAGENRSLITSPIVAVSFPMTESAGEESSGRRQGT